VTAAALLPLWLLAAAPADARTPTQEITVDVRGPVALVEVVRPLTAEANDVGHGSGERLLDVALPEGAGLVDAHLRDARGWREIAVAGSDAASTTYTQRFSANGFAPAREPFDDATSFRVRVAKTAGDRRAPVELRYRFSLLPELVNGRRRIRFPASPERLPVPAAVRVSAPGVVDVQIAGAPVHGSSTVRVPARSAWEVSWAAAVPRPAGGGATLWATTATGPVSDGSFTLAVAVEARAGRDAGPPPNVLLVIDRSRSVGLAGAATERDFARKLLELLPPSTRFDGLFFDQGVSRLFPMSRPATREALAAIDAELLPDRLRNGTDLPAALRAAGDLLRREATTFAPRVLVALVTDGALPDGADASALDHALGAVPGVDVQVAAFVVRPTDDEPAPFAALRALHGFAALRGGIERELRANEVDEGIPPALAALAVGGDVSDVELYGQRERLVIADRLAPGEGRTRAYAEVPKPRRGLELVSVSRGAKLHVAPHPVKVEDSWLLPLLSRRAPARGLVTDELVALVEPAQPPHVVRAQFPKGSLDREVVRNTLALAYLPRARACYLSRSGATPAERDLAGRVRLDIDLARGEVGRVVVESSTLASPGVEACLREGALALDVPRALRNDFPVTARLNLVFRPRTPEKATTAGERALGEQIDLVIEDLHRAGPPPVTESPAMDRSMIPTR
jgi:hypothetical protein